MKINEINNKWPASGGNIIEIGESNSENRVSAKAAKSSGITKAKRRNEISMR
jgi:hypothetical protein